MGSAVILSAATVLGGWTTSSAEDPAARGAQIYRELCVSCHGPMGEGVEGRYSRPLVGDKPVSRLRRIIERSMPDDEPEACVGEDAGAVAQYIYDAFYSPIAQSRLEVPRVQLSRLTVRQYRNAVADLVSGARPAAFDRGERGLRAQYFDSHRIGGKQVADRVDPQVRFHWGRTDPMPPAIGPEGFTARWDGSVLADQTGRHAFVVRTDQAARLWVNDLETPLVDVWVKSGNDTEHSGSTFLVGGRAYPIRLEFTSRKQGVQDQGKRETTHAFLELCWRAPNRATEVIPSSRLSPERAPELYVAEAPFPPDDRSVGYERGTSVSRAWLESATAAAIDTAHYVIRHLDRLAGVARDAPDHGDAVRAFARRFVRRAFRRPLSEEEGKLYIERQLRDAPDLDTALKRVVVLTLVSPRFLYVDLGGGEQDPFATASRLSFTLWDSLPDDELLEAAASGRLVSEDHARCEAERMVSDLRTRSKTREFLHSWLGIDQVPDLSKDPERYAGFDESLASDLRTSLDLFLDDVVWGEECDFRRLFLSNELYLNGRLGAYYGVDLPRDASFRKVRVESARRTGVLTHPYLMARYSYRDATSPIHRGVFLVRGVLGRSLMPPPEAFAPLSADLHPELTTRERVTLQTAPENCQGCHAMINPLGFALEHFDADGRYREAERGKPIDASGMYETSSGERATFGGARELAEYLATSAETRRAFIEAMFHHLAKQPVRAYGDDTLDRLEGVFVSSGFHIRTLIREVAVTSARAASEKQLQP